MSKRWRNAGLILAAIAVVASLVNGWSPWLPTDVPVVLRAAFNGASVFVGVWLYEGIYRVALWVTRFILRMASPRSDRRDESEPRPRA